MCTTTDNEANVDRRTERVDRDLNRTQTVAHFVRAATGRAQIQVYHLLLACLLGAKRWGWEFAGYHEANVDRRTERVDRDLNRSQTFRACGLSSFGRSGTATGRLQIPVDEFVARGFAREKNTVGLGFEPEEDDRAHFVRALRLPGVRIPGFRFARHVRSSQKRWGWDLNPGIREDTCFQGRRNGPLCHPTSIIQF